MTESKKSEPLPEEEYDTESHEQADAPPFVIGTAPSHNYVKMEIKNVGAFEMQSPDTTQEDMFINVLKFLNSMGIVGTDGEKKSDHTYI